MREYTTKYTREMLEPIVRDSFSYAQVMRKLGYQPSGSLYASIKLRIKEYGLDISHFRSQAWNIGAEHKGGSDKKTAEQILILKDPLSRREEVKRLRRALIETGVPEICAICELVPEWNGLPLRLQVDHIN